MTLAPHTAAPTALCYVNETARKCAVIQTVKWVSKSQFFSEHSSVKEISSNSVYFNNVRSNIQNLTRTRVHESIQAI